MALKPLINEGSSFTLTVLFLDETELPMTPASASYEVLCMTSETTIRLATAITPLATSVDIVIDETDNSIQDSVNNERETRRVIVTTINSDGEPYVDDYEYSLKRMSYI